MTDTVTEPTTPPVTMLAQGAVVAPVDKPTHLPPQNLEAEEAILGAMLMTDTAIQRAHDAGLRAGDFYRDSHRTIFEAIMHLSGQGLVDELVVVNYLKSQNRLSGVGGSSAIFSLSQRVPAVSNAKAYALEVVSQSTLRGLVETGHQIAQLGYDHPDDSDKLVAAAGVLLDDLIERRSSSGVGFVTLRDALADVYEHLQERESRGQTMAGIPTGLHAIDARWGGLTPGELIVIAARPGMGKSALMATLAENMVFMSGEDVIVVNLEMSVRQQAARALSRLSSIHVSRTTQGVPHEHDWAPMHAAISNAYELAGRMHFDESSDLTISQLRQRVRTMRRRIVRENRKLGGVFVDYTQLLNADSNGGRGSENRTQEMTQITRGLKSMALELDIPVIVLSQLNRQVENRPDKTPQLSDLRESGSIEQDADIVAFLMRPEYYTKDETPPEWIGRCRVITAKQRNGAPGEDILRFEGQFTRFVNDQYNAGVAS
jgi:replicative DNA helicase